jgi:hypothetical protein
MGVVILTPEKSLPIGEPMNSGISSRLLFFYRLLLQVYPAAYRAEFGNEMYATFLEGVEEAQAQRRLGIYLLRELRDTPRSLANAYWQGWMMKLQTRIQVLHDVASTSDLPPAPPDGRESWRQVLWELSPFLLAAFFLVLATYVPFVEISPGWQRDTEFLATLIVPLTLPFVVLGLARGLPRWAYPYAGLLLGYQIFVSYQSSMWLFLIAMLFAYSVLAAAALITDPHPSRLPVLVRRIGQSLSLDWTRLSFGIFGAMPLILLVAFDDAHANGRTTYLALSALGMVVSAFAYCRSRTTSAQITALLSGLTFTIWCAWMDKITFAGGLVGWVTVPSAGLDEMFWLLRLWLQWGVLILSPALLVMMGRAAVVKRSI